MGTMLKYPVIAAITPLCPPRKQKLRMQGSFARPAVGSWHAVAHSSPRRAWACGCCAAGLAPGCALRRCCCCWGSGGGCCCAPPSFAAAAAHDACLPPSFPRNASLHAAASPSDLWSAPPFSKVSKSLCKP